MNKITKILSLTLPMISIAPIASLSAHNTNVATKTTRVEVRDAGWPDITHYELEVTDNAWKKKDYLTGKMTADIIEWNKNQKRFSVAFDVVSDKSTEHDGGWDSWHSEFEVAYSGNYEQYLYSKNKKAYLSVDVVANQNRGCIYLEFNVLSAYSWVTNEDECIVG